MEARARRPTFGGVLLGALIVLMGATALLAAALYVRPARRLTIPEHQPAIRIADEADVPVGSSRMQNWGRRIVLVVRTGESSFTAVQGTSPLDGCLLTWDAASRRIASPCHHVLYDLHGRAVEGLTVDPLHMYEVFVRDGTIYVTDPES